MRKLLVVFLTIFPLFFGGWASAQFGGPLSDEFDDSSTLIEWLEGPVSPYDLLDIDTSNAGQLTLVPSDFSHNGWYANYNGPYRYKLVEGDFAATMYVHTGNVNDNDAPPTGDYNSAGFVIRDPASTSGAENWLMYNVGRQTAGTGLATEAKTTLNSSSILTLRPTGGQQAGRLTVCRSGNTFYMLKWLDAESDWTLEETATLDHMPNELQVGMVVNAWENSDLYARFDYLRITTATTLTLNDCLAIVNSVPASIELSESEVAVATDNIFLLGTMALGLGLLTGFVFGRKQTNVASERLFY